ncbi:ANKRD7, partial [Symbiodinium sp. KB8]
MAGPGGMVELISNFTGESFDPPVLCPMARVRFWVILAGFFYKITALKRKTLQDLGWPSRLMAVRSPLHQDSTQDLVSAARRGDEAEIRKILSQRQDPDAAYERDDVLGLPLFFNFFFGEYDRAYRNRSQQRRALAAAVVAGNLSAARLLLKLGASPNAALDTGWAPLHEAAAGDDQELARLLLKWGADIHQRNHRGHTPFIVAVGRGYLEMAKFLLRKGANPRDRDARGIPVVVLALEARKTRMANWLLDSGLAVEEGVPPTNTEHADLLSMALEWVVARRVMPAFDGLAGAPQPSSPSVREYMKEWSMAEQLLHESGVDPKITPCARSCSAFDEWGDSLFFRPMRMFIFMSAAERRVRAESSRLVEPVPSAHGAKFKQALSKREYAASFGKRRPACRLPARQPSRAGKVHR